MAAKRNGKWQGDFRHQGTRYRKTGFDTKQEAEAWEAMTQARLLQGLDEHGRAPAATKPWSMQDLYDASKARFWAGKPNERMACSNALQAVDYFGPAFLVGDMSTIMVDKYMAALKEAGNAPSTINRKVSALSRMMSYAVSRGLLDKSPTIEREREPQHRLRWYTSEEERRILIACDALGCPVLLDLLVFLADTGFRLGEAMNASAGDCDDLYIRAWKTKTNKFRAVPLTSRVREILTRRTSGKLFQFVTINDLYAQWYKVKIRADIRDAEANLHAWRHTYASRLVQRGVNLATIRELMGHESIATTMRYAHLHPTSTLSVVSILDELATAADFQRDKAKSQSDGHQGTKPGHEASIRLA